MGVVEQATHRVVAMVEVQVQAERLATAVRALGQETKPVPRAVLSLIQLELKSLQVELVEDVLSSTLT